MVKPFASNPLDSLVDLACRDGVDIRPTLLRVVTDLYVQKPVHSAEEETQFVELALGLVAAVDAQTRATVAATLSNYPGAPAAVVSKLVDRPSSGAETRGQPERIDLIELFFSALPEERRLILTNLDVASGKAVRRPMPDASELIRRLEGAALKRNPGEFSRVLERALDISRTLAEKITRDDSGEPIIIAAKILGMKAEVLQRILLFLNPVVGQSSQRVYELCRLFDEISPASADHMLTIWRASARRHSAHEPVYWNDERHAVRPTARSAQRTAGGSDVRPARFKRNER